MCKQSVQPFGSTFPLFTPFGARPLPSFCPLFAPPVHAQTDANTGPHTTRHPPLRPCPFTRERGATQEGACPPFSPPTPVCAQRRRGEVCLSPPLLLSAPIHVRTGHGDGTCFTPPPLRPRPRSRANRARK